MEKPKFSMDSTGGGGVDKKTSPDMEKMTPQKMLAQEIRKAYPTSHAFLQEILNAGNANWATNKEPDVQGVIVQLAQKHRGIKEHGAYTAHIEDQGEREKKFYERGLWLGSMVAAIYHGELTMMGKDGKLLAEPEAL